MVFEVNKIRRDFSITNFFVFVLFFLFFSKKTLKNICKMFEIVIYYS
uniref:Uncharacterized protein n=1 Tax=Borrelia turicatae (strain 91E135) TaxID=314724 RepID=A0A0R9P5M1_BORT9|nr:hypothetical protein BTA099a [Borrelia turicatae 91E135]